MQKLTHRILLTLCLLLAGGYAVAQSAAPLEGVVRVKLQREVLPALQSAGTRAAAPGQTLRVGVATLDASLLQIKGMSIRPVFPCPPGREAAHAEYGLDQWYEITFDTSVNPLQAKHLLTETPGIMAAGVRTPAKLLENPSRYRVVDPASAPAAAASQMPFNDPRLSQQWHYTNDGSLNGAVAGADINLFKAWQLETGKDNVVVAIVDGGVDVNHEDLAKAMWTNDAEKYGQPGVDDDGNGYVDDIYGFNFCTFNGTIYPHSHGTHVAGTVGAVNNNGIGVGGVAGGDGTPGSGVKLMSCQVFDSRSGAGDADYAAALVYAADMGATIAQCSWGWDGDGYYEQDVLDAVRYFTNTARSNNMTGGLCIFAAGNTGTSGMFYPSCMDEVVAVGSMCYDLTPAPYSSYGEWVDVTAPGGNLDYDNSQGILSTLPDNTYGFSEGTSMATPHVSGIAALILSKYGSPSLVNETVRQQLVTSVNDLYSRNPQAEGLFGSGYIDAWKALQWGDGTAPEAVSDLRAVASQDNVVLTWTIPASSDNNVNSHIIYYSTEPFTAANTAGCSTAIVDTKFNVSGDPCTYEIDGLSAMTTYYFGIVALDRWSNASPMSEIVSVTTNEGPEMKLSRTAMNIKCLDGSTWSSSSFDITNTASGLLKWKAYTRTFSSTITNYGLNRGLATVPWSGHTDGIRYSAAANTVVQAIEDFEREDFPQSFSNVKQLYAYIGDTEAELSNSMAQLFTVDASEYPDGFNLTHIYLEGAYGLKPTIQIYRNTGTLSNSTLLGEQQLLTEASPYYTDIELTESYWFAPGESFYVVVHFTEGSDPSFPLGLGLSNGNAAAAHAYMSTDLGETWTLLSEAIKGSNYESIAGNCAWDIIVKSKYPDWSQILTIDPAEGQIEGGQSQTVAVSHNGTRVPNGSYRARLHFDTNETNPAGKTINVNITVEGNQPVVSFNKVLQFGNVLVGQKKSITVEIANIGYGSFAGGSNFAGIYGDKITSTSDQFQGPAYLQNGIPSRSTERFDVTFAPTREGSHFGQIVIKDYRGNELVINVQGAATQPSKIATDPQVIEVGDINADRTEVETTFAIRNEGNYPLQWMMPKYSDADLDEVQPGDMHRFGYNWLSNLYGSEAVTYTEAPELVNAVDVTSQVGDYDYFTDPVDIGFRFPFYGRTYDKLYISSLGMLTFDTYTEGTIYSPVDEDTYTYLSGLGVISAYGYELDSSPATRIEYGMSDGKFVVNFRDVMATVYDTDQIPITFHIMLSPTGDIEIGYDDYTAAAVFQQGKNIWVGIVDPEMDDPMTITSSNYSAASAYFGSEEEINNRWKHINSGTAFTMLAPRPDMIKAIEPTSGIVPPGDQVQVKAVVAATDDMYVGPTSTNLVILSNDVTTPTHIVTFNANVTGDLRAVFDISAESVDFGNVFRTSEARRSVAVQNHGRNYMTVESVAVEGASFSHNFTEAVQVAPGQSKDIMVTLATEAEGEAAGTLTVTTSEGTKTVALSGTVIGVPEATFSYESLDETVPYGETKAVPLTVTNSGNEPLTFSVTTGPHMSYKPEFEDGASVDYVYSASLDDASALREWYDIETTGLGQQYNYTYFITKDIVEVELPFEFNFYGVNYSKMYVYDAGFVSFTERNDEGIWPVPPMEFPDGSVYNNLIAPYWGLHTMNITATAGVYVYANESEAVVSYMEYGNSMNYDVDFQVVIRKDGTFTFNYKEHSNYAVLYGAFGVSGISDAHNNGIHLPERYICLNTSLTFSPVVECVVAPGEARVADLSLVADELAGNYTSKITVSTNVPTAPRCEIPVALTVTGEPAPVFPDDVEASFVAGYQDTNYDDELIGYYGSKWYVPLIVRNDGAATFTIDAIDFESPELAGQPLFELYWYGTTTDWTGAPTVGWSAYSGQAITVGKSLVKLAIPASPYNNSIYAWETPGTYDLKLTFHVSGVEGLATRVVNVKIVVTEQPTLETDVAEIRISDAEDTVDEVRSLTVSNANGAATLTYTLTVDPSGVGEVEPDYAPAPMAVSGQALQADPAEVAAFCAELPQTTFEGGIRPADVGYSDDLYNAPSLEDIEYRRALYWPALPSNRMSYNYGSNTTYGTYRAATAYVGPEDGFNISYIYTAFHPYNLDNKDIVVEIYGSDPQLGDNILGRGTLNIGDVFTPLYQSVLRIVPLDRPVYIAEGQEFWVVITYPAGQEFPTTLCYKQDPVTSNRYMGYVDGYGWFDVATFFSESYGSLGYIASCIETVEGGSWIRLLNSDGTTAMSHSGEIAPGASETLDFTVVPINAAKETGNKAMLVIKSNDPKSTVVNLPVYLDKNCAPVVTVPKGSLTIDQGASASFEAVVTEPESEDFTVLAVDNGQATRIAAAVTTDGNGSVAISEDGLSASATGTAGVKVTFEIAPGFDLLGEHTVTVVATDAREHEARKNMNYTVARVNRAPIAIGHDNISVAVGQCTPVISLDDMFTDPDGDELTYTISSSVANVKFYRSDNDLIIEGLTMGKSRVTVRATDIDGATASTGFLVSVGASGIDGISVIEGLSVYPNPVVETLFVTADCDIECALYSIAGAQVLQASFERATGNVHAIDVTALPAGTYVFRATDAAGRTAAQVVIKN